jgi:hypothetical protein
VLVPRTFSRWPCTSPFFSNLWSSARALCKMRGAPELLYAVRETMSSPWQVHIANAVDNEPFRYALTAVARRGACYHCRLSRAQLSEQLHTNIQVLCMVFSPQVSL